MKKDIKILIIPDVHGRDFWADAVMNNLDKEIVFLGDYLDPYSPEGITKERAIEVFREIIDLKKEHKNITLLLGNHDCSYALSTTICECRHDWTNHGEISRLFQDNFDFFDIAKEKTINKKRFFFCHAGIHKSWIKANSFLFPPRFNPSAKNFNALLHSDDKEIRRKLCNALSNVSYYRGGYEGFGSIVWADVSEFLNSKEIRESKKVFVVGHTHLKNAVRLCNNLYCLDCKKAFYIDSKGIVRYYDTDEEIDIEIK